MTITLAQLRESVNDLIKNQGPDAPVAAWICTKDDVVDYPDGGVNVTEEIAFKVIENLDQYDHIYTEIFDLIDQELREANVLE